MASQYIGNWLLQWLNWKKLKTPRWKLTPISHTEHIGNSVPSEWEISQTDFSNSQSKKKKKKKSQTKEERRSNPIEKHQHHALSSLSQYCLMQTWPGEGTLADKGVIQGAWCPFICSFIDGWEPSGDNRGKGRCRWRCTEVSLPSLSQSCSTACADRLLLHSVVSSATSVWNWKWKWMNYGGNSWLWCPPYQKLRELLGMLCYRPLTTTAVETVQKPWYQQTADGVIGTHSGRTAGVDSGELKSL